VSLGSPGVVRGLGDCASPAGAFTLLALDHRQNLRHDLRPSDPASVSGEELTDFKLAAVRAMADVATGVLLDPEFGAEQAIAAGALPKGVGLVVALEETGYTGSATDRRSRLLADWSPERLRQLGASAAKLLVYYHPDAPGAPDQERLVASTVRACHDVDLAVFLEPLTFSLDAGTKLVGEGRRRAVIRTAQRLASLGVDVLKVEFPYDPSVVDRGRWQDACAELDESVHVPWVLLSGGVDTALFMEQVSIACSAGASGVAAGRALWAEATTLTGVDRESFLRGAARDRLSALRALADRVARPWTSIDHEPGRG
jgi:tagatose-1,6-bisphosphate aldolase